MTGWRLGWAILPRHLLTPFERLAQNLTIAPSTVAQRAAIAAFDCHDELRANVERYASSRSMLLGALNKMGITGLAPADGAFYVWADVEHLINDGRATDTQDLCQRWLEELDVATTPGIDFDQVQGRHVRFASATPAPPGTSKPQSHAWLRGCRERVTMTS